MEGRSKRAAVSDVTRLTAPIGGSAAPYPHWVLEPFDRGFLADAKDELLALGTSFKETDLFRINQSVDFANLSPESFPRIAQLKASLYSPAFRAHIEAVTQCGRLNSRVDCAANIYSQGCHLGCHDDCISTRRISYILYLSDDGWTREDGGELELYAPDDFVPRANIAPLFGTMMTFRVAAGESLHSVQEVFSASRRRISIQGWFHTDEPIAKREAATISQLTTAIRSAVVFSNAAEDYDLTKWINPVYLKAGEALKRCLQASGCVQLNDFVAKSVFGEIAAATSACDLMDSLGNWHRPDYSDGIKEGFWKLTGPPHVQRYCEGSLSVSETVAKSKLGRAAQLLGNVYRMLVSKSFLKWIATIGGDATVASALIRRFRPGLDYTVARGQIQTGSMLHVTFCTVPESSQWKEGNVGGHHIFTNGDEDPETARKEAEVYQSEGDGDIVSVCPAPNSLSIVSVPKSQKSPMQFVQYVSAGAPG